MTSTRPPNYGSPQRDDRNDSKWWIWVALGAAAVLVAIVLFFALGGDADVDSDPGSIDVEAPAVDADVDAPDVDLESPDVDVDVDPGSVDVDDADAEANVEE